MPAMYDDEGPLYVVSPKGFSTVLARVEANFPNVEANDTQPLQPGRYRHLVHLRGEPFPGDIPLAHQLALAVLKGDTGAALLLADLVQEQHTGSRSELQAEMAKRVDEAAKTVADEERDAVLWLLDAIPRRTDDEQLALAVDSFKYRFRTGVAGGAHREGYAKHQ